MSPTAKFNACLKHWVKVAFEYSDSRYIIPKTTHVFSTIVSMSIWYLIKYLIKVVAETRLSDSYKYWQNLNGLHNLYLPNKNIQQTDRDYYILRLRQPYYKRRQFHIFLTIYLKSINVILSRLYPIQKVNFWLTLALNFISWSTLPSSFFPRKAKPWRDKNCVFWTIIANIRQFFIF